MMVDEKKAIFSINYKNQLLHPSMPGSTVGHADRVPLPPQRLLPASGDCVLLSDDDSREAEDAETC